MLTIYQMNEKYNVSIRKLRRMQKDGCLRSDSSGDPIADDIRVMLSSGQHLSVKHIVALLEKPELVGELGDRQDIAQAQLRAIGKPEPAPDDLWPEMAAAAANDPAALLKLIAWAQDVLPAGQRVRHHWLAVRLALAVPENLRKYEYPRLNRILHNMRRQPAFSGWFTVNRSGARSVTWYHKPEGFDL